MTFPSAVFLPDGTINIHSSHMIRANALSRRQLTTNKKHFNLHDFAIYSLTPNFVFCIINMNQPQFFTTIVYRQEIEMDAFTTGIQVIVNQPKLKFAIAELSMSISLYKACPFKIALSPSGKVYSPTSSRF